VGGALVKTCIIALRRSTFLKEKNITFSIFLLGSTDKNRTLTKTKTKKLIRNLS